jgi:hypothetical protein
MPNQTCEFIGGPWDGHIVRWEPEASPYEVRPNLHAGYQFQHLYRSVWNNADPNRRAYVYVGCTIAPKDPLTA